MRSRNKYSGETQTSRRSGEHSTVSFECDRDGITIEADQRHVREIMKDREMERANHSATPCAVERGDESKGENRCGRGQTKRRWDDVNDDDNGDRLRMPDDDAIDRQVVTSHDTEHSLHESVTCHMTVQISSSHRCGYVV